jgi:hypothetical protein
MTAPIRQRAPLPASDERPIVRRRAAWHDRAMAAAGVPPAKPRHARCGLISLPRLSAYDHGDVTLASLRGELDLSGTVVLQAPLRDIRWPARLGSVAGPTAYPSPGGTSLSVPAGRCKPIRERAGGLTPGWAAGRRRAPGLATHRPASRRMTAPGTPSLALGAPITVFPAAPVQPEHHSRRNSAHQRRQVRDRSWAP